MLALQVFAVWMRILKAIPAAKLWLLKFTQEGAANLLASAAKLKVHPSRLVFHDQFPREREFRIKGLAQLFLDTPLFNAHTTAVSLPPSHHPPPLLQSPLPPLL
jgi:protein O-GlcNAc transferase